MDLRYQWFRGELALTDANTCAGCEYFLNGLLRKEEER